MRSLTLLTLTVLAMLVLPGCGKDTQEQPAAGPEDTRPPAAQSAAPTERPGKQETPRIATEEQLRAALGAKNPEFAGGLQTTQVGPNGLIVAINDPAVEDISPLAGLPLRALDLMGSHVTDISPLRGMQLVELHLEETGVEDISVVRGMPLVKVSLSNTKVWDISPLRDAPLEELRLVNTRVTDLGPLGGMPLRSLWLNGCPVTDISPLRTVPLESLTLAGSKVSDLSPLEGHPLKRLHIARSEVTDLTPLRSLRLSRLVFTPARITKGIEHARNMRSLQRIGTEFGEGASDLTPPAAFWRLYDAGKFK